MELKKDWTAFSTEEKRAFRTLYRTAFPKEERVPWLLLRHMERKGRCVFGSYLDGGGLIGMTVSVPCDTFEYLFFLAVAENRRGQGYGSWILQRICDGCDKTLILDIERVQPSPNLEERKKRRQFYLDNGFVSAEFYYSFMGVDYETLFRGGSFPLEAFQAFLLKRFREYKN